MQWQEGDVLIEKSNRHGDPRAVIVTKCPQMYEEERLGDRRLQSRTWGWYLEPDGNWGGPWHAAPEKLNQHPDPDAVWAKWAEHCARALTT